jgi:hypothetical protein
MPCYHFATQLPNTKRERAVPVGMRCLLGPNKISRLRLKAHCTVQSQANCKTPYTSSILVVAGGQQDQVAVRMVLHGDVQAAVMRP